MTTAGASVAADRHGEGGRTPAHRLVRQPPDHGVTRCAFAAAAPAPLVRLDDPAGQHRPIWFEPLAGDDEAELVDPAERGQIRARAYSSNFEVSTAKL